MSPRLTSAITISPASRAYAQTPSKERTPSAPSASKKADCGFTAAAYGATASTIPRQKEPTATDSRSANDCMAWGLCPRLLPALDGGLERAAGRELRNPGGRDVDLLGRV